jgi:hypothetical protein
MFVALIMVHGEGHQHRSSVSRHLFGSRLRRRFIESVPTIGELNGKYEIQSRERIGFNASRRGNGSGSVKACSAG